MPSARRVPDRSSVRLHPSQEHERQEEAVFKDFRQRGRFDYGPGIPTELRRAEDVQVVAATVKAGFVGIDQIVPRDRPRAFRVADLQREPVLLVLDHLELARQRRRAAAGETAHDAIIRVVNFYLGDAVVRGDSNFSRTRCAPRVICHGFSICELRHSHWRIFGPCVT